MRRLEAPRRLARTLLGAAVSVVVSSCLGTTGNTLVQFRAAASGPADATPGVPLEFTSGLGWHVVLTKATLHVGAIYLDQTLPTSGGGPAACVLPGTYVAQVTTPQGSVAGIDVDVLSPLPQWFPDPGQGTDLPAKVAQVWLTGAEGDEPDDPTTILHLEGTADRGGQAYPFVAAKITISKNRAMTPSDATKPGSYPICAQRIVSPIVVDIVPENGGTLLLRVDPRQLFVDIDFSALPSTGGPSPQYAFSDDSTNVPSANLYSALRSAGALYQLTWQPPAP
jgi:hypothetical protein